MSESTPTPDGADSRAAFESFIQRINTASGAALMLERGGRGIYIDKGVQSAWAMWVAAVAWTQGDTVDVR